MRRLLVIVVLAAVVTGVVTYWALNRPYQEAYTPDNLIRLHVVANSDRPQDQSLKYRVRDAILQELSPQFARVQGVAEAEEVVRQSRQHLEDIANRCLASAGASYRARVEVGVFAFPTRAYYQTVLPAGSYRAVRVVLGAGEGANWWCVLFPPLCFVDIASSEAAVPVQEVMAPSGTERAGQEKIRPSIEKRWRLVEWWRQSQQRLARLWPQS
ncbi:MAG: stage II sporulation protein R [Moorellales bacterium]